MLGEAGWKEQAEKQEEEVCVMNQCILSARFNLLQGVAASCRALVSLHPRGGCITVFTWYIWQHMKHFSSSLLHRIVPVHWDAAGATVYKQLYKNKQKLTEPAWFPAGCQSQELTLRTALIFFPCV